MPKLFFNLSIGGELIPDEEGADFGSLKDAKIDAAVSVRQIIGSRLLHGQEISPVKIDIVDQQGTVLLTVLSTDILDRIRG